MADKPMKIEVEVVPEAKEWGSPVKAENPSYCFIGVRINGVDMQPPPTAEAAADRLKESLEMREFKDELLSLWGEIQSANMEHLNILRPKFNEWAMREYHDAEAVQEHREKSDRIRLALALLEFTEEMEQRHEATVGPIANSYTSMIEYAKARCEQ